MYSLSNSHRQATIAEANAGVYREKALSRRQKNYPRRFSMAPRLTQWHPLYFNPMIFRLEHLSLVETIVKHIHFQDHIQEMNAL